MSAVPLLFVLHNHQPVGNFAWVFEECYQNAYRPFLEVLERHPGIRIGLHYTGPLFEWLQQEHPDYFARVRALVDAGQVEVLGGAFYEPILSVIPERDRPGQLLLLREEVEKTFGRAPEGAWLAERVWEPFLPGCLHDAGVRYVLVDDEAFHRLGFTEQQTQTTYLTEDQGKILRLLPISRRLRYTLPAKTVDEVLATLREMAADGAEALIYAEDGERYGSWPGTAEFMYGEEAYVDALFTALEAANDIAMILPGEYVRQNPARDLVYLPPTSYQEMLEWSGGFWRNFLTRYRESNLMHKKVYQVSRWVALAEDAGHDVRSAQRDLYAAECNCAYWYGSFGGVYLPHLRRAVYRHVLRAERAVAPLLSPSTRGAIEIIDHDCDGHEEIFLRAGDLSVGIAPGRGGALFALEHLGAEHNFLATMGRYPLQPIDEEEEQPEEALPVDWYPRYAFLDHILAHDATPEGFRDVRYGEQGDFILGAYTILETGAQHVTLRRDGHFWDGPEFVPFRITKSYAIHDESLVVTYTLTNTSSVTRSLRFAVEVNACLSAGDAPGRALRVDDTTRSLAQLDTATGVSTVRYRDDWLGAALQLAWDQPAELWICPIYTPLRSLNGLEWVYQSTASLPIWEMTLPPGAPWAINLTIDVSLLRQQTSIAASV